MNGALAVMILMACQHGADDCAPATLRAQRFATLAPLREARGMTKVAFAARSAASLLDLVCDSPAPG